MMQWVDEDLRDCDPTLAFLSRLPLQFNLSPADAARKVQRAGRRRTCPPHPTEKAGLSRMSAFPGPPRVIIKATKGEDSDRGDKAGFLR
jgi:hypothetical protein